MEKVEEVARAIYALTPRGLRGISADACFTFTLEPNWTDCEPMARAAITAMSIPTATMLKSGADCMPDMDCAPESYAVAIDDAGTIWQAMVASSI